jgi:hypothetical protein
MISMESNEFLVQDPIVAQNTRVQSVFPTLDFREVPIGFQSDLRIRSDGSGYNIWQC